MKKDLTNKELFRIIKLAVEGDINSKFEIIFQFEELINKEARVNGKYSQECRDYIEDKIIENIEKFKKIKNTRYFIIKKFAYVYKAIIKLQCTLKIK